MAKLKTSNAPAQVLVGLHCFVQTQLRWGCGFQVLAIWGLSLSAETLCLWVSLQLILACVLDSMATGYHGRSHVQKDHIGELPFQ